MSESLLGHRYDREEKNLTMPRQELVMCSHTYGFKVSIDTSYIYLDDEKDLKRSIDRVRDGVRVNAVYPGITESERFLKIILDRASMRGQPIAQAKKEILNRESVRRVGQPEDVAHLVRFLVSSEAEHIQGTSIAIDGGATKGLF